MAKSARWWARIRPRRRRGSARDVARVDGDAVAYLRHFAATRIGVEGFVEPRTTVTEPTMVLVARDGEWTRRRVPDDRAAHALCNDIGIPSYDATKVGYPARMRSWSARRKQGEV